MWYPVPGAFVPQALQAPVPDPRFPSPILPRIVAIHILERPLVRVLGANEPRDVAGMNGTAIGAARVLRSRFAHLLRVQLAEAAEREARRRERMHAVVQI